MKIRFTTLLRMHLKKPLSITRKSRRRRRGKRRREKEEVEVEER